MFIKKKTVIILTVLQCLIFGQLVAAPAQAQLDGSKKTVQHPPANAQASPEEYAEAFDLALKVMQHKRLYAVINDAFKDKIAPNAQAKGLALSQVVYMLVALQGHWDGLHAYLETVPSDVAPGDLEETRQQFKVMFDEFMANKTQVEKLTRHNDPTQPLLLETKGVESGYSKIEMFVNHPSLEDPNKPNGNVIPAQDLRKLIVDFVGEAESEIWYNAFDIDLKDFGDALLDAKKRKVAVKGGVDKRNYADKPAVKEWVDRLLKHETKAFSTKVVDSVGLNHQKIIIRDPFGPKAAVLFLSGNFTQSCLGPEGDGVLIPANERPDFSIPNANHAVLIEGKLPAVVARQELMKILEYDLRGKSGFPTGGAFQLKGPRDSITGKATWLIMTFSPNGGLGDINRDVLSSLFAKTTGRIEAGHFAFSASGVKDSIIAHATAEAKRRKKQGRPANDLLKTVGDAPFAMRDWSAFLNLSGLSLDITTGIYSPIKDAPMKNVLNAEDYKAWQNNIRLAPGVYGDRSFRMSNGEAIKISAKFHHKVFILPDHNISVVGTSFNPSENASINNEQVLIVKDAAITKRARGMLAHHWYGSRGSVLKDSERRNENPRPQKNSTPIDDLLDPKAKEVQSETKTLVPGGKVRACSMLFSA